MLQRMILEATLFACILGGMFGPVLSTILITAGTDVVKVLEKLSTFLAIALAGC